MFSGSIFATIAFNRFSTVASSVARRLTSGAAPAFCDARSRVRIFSRSSASGVGLEALRDKIQDLRSGLLLFRMLRLHSPPLVVPADVIAGHVLLAA